MRSILSASLVCLAMHAVFAQAPLSFEVASVRPNTDFPPMGSGRQIGPEQFESIGLPLISIITLAYGVTRIEGAPEWVRSERYDIRAKATKPSSRQEMLQMLQALLADRFGLKTHSETRVVDIYGLVFAEPARKLGPRLRPVKVDCETNEITDGPDPGIFPPGQRPRCGTTSVSTAMVSGPVVMTTRHPAVTMERLAQSLSGGVGRPVFDRTGLAGTFDAELKYIREMPPGPGFSPRPEGAPVPDGVSFRDAIKQQLGLDLRSERGPVEFLVIDAIERPKSN